ncbi:hypothetical protein PR003_g26680 [Phytophthora rubi]|nr:hypothetical protein PR003_g26680 [Phytophthora rubi]
MAFTAIQWSGARAVATESPEDGYEGRNRRRTCVEAKGAKKISEEGIEPSISSV